MKDEDNNASGDEKTKADSSAAQSAETKDTLFMRLDDSTRVNLV